MASSSAARNKAVDASTPQIDVRYACYRIKIAPSKIHRWGVYTTEDIPARRKVIEYFTLDPYWTIDGSVGGSGAQYINHSCEPNLVARIVKGHIIYVALRPIKKGEELTVDYHFDKKVERVPCGCGTAKCRGTINVL